MVASLPMAKLSISIDDADIAWLKRRAARVHGGNLSAAVAEGTATQTKHSARSSTSSVNFATAFNPFESNFRYGGYFDITDTFGSTMTDSAGGINCNECATNPANCCPSTHTCRTSTDESPRSLAGGLCARNCTTPGASCAPFENDLACGAYAPSPTGNICWHSDYTNNWFTTVGTRLVFDSQWDEALLVLLAAQAGSSFKIGRAHV